MICSSSVLTELTNSARGGDVMPLIQVKEPRFLFP